MKKLISILLFCSSSLIAAPDSSVLKIKSIIALSDQPLPAATTLTTDQNRIVQQTVPQKNINDAAFYALDKTNKNFVFAATDLKKELGLYWMSPNGLKTITDQSNTIPNGAGYFQSIEQLCYIAPNQFAFIGHGLFGQAGIYLYDGNALVKVTDQHTVSPRKEGLLTTYKILSCGQNMLAFSAVTDDGMGGVFTYNNGALSTLLTTQSVINKQTFSKIDISPNSLQQNQLIFSATDDKNQTSTYLATLEAIG